LDKKNNLNTLLLQAASYNKEHGDRLSEDDTSSVARRVAINDPEEKIPQAEIAKYLGRSQQRVSDYISDIRATQTASRDSLIYRLNLLGWTLEEIEKITGLKKSRLNEISGNTNIGKIGNSLEEWISKGKTVEEAAKKLEIDGILAWAIILKDK
jgi:predicted transcriptional regulator